MHVCKGRERTERKRRGEREGEKERERGRETERERERKTERERKRQRERERDYFAFGSINNRVRGLLGLISEAGITGSCTFGVGCLR